MDINKKRLSVKEVISVVVSIILISIVIRLIVIFLTPIIIGGGFVMDNKDGIKNDFERYNEYFVLINEYLTGIATEQFYLPDLDNVEMNDNAVLQALKYLDKKGYKSITKNDNAITYVKVSKLDIGKGIVYSIDGEKPKVEYLTDIEVLPTENWYYYESDYNKWRSR